MNKLFLAGMFYLRCLLFLTPGIHLFAEPSPFSALMENPPENKVVEKKDSQPPVSGDNQQQAEEKKKQQISANAQTTALLGQAKQKVFENKLVEAIKLLEEAEILQDSEAVIEVRKLLFLLKGRTGQLQVSFASATLEEKPGLMLALADGWFDFGQNQRRLDVLLRAKDLYAKIFTEMEAPVFQVRALLMLGQISSYQNNPEQTIYFMSRLIAGFSNLDQFKDSVAQAYLHLGEALGKPGRYFDPVRGQKALRKASATGAGMVKVRAEELLKEFSY